jgi:large subunit ribosomal protein L1
LGLVGRLGKVLGPRGLMPNRRVGSVSRVVTAGVLGALGGGVVLRFEKSGMIHAGIGKASFSELALLDNIKAFVDAVVKARPAGAKGTYLKRVAVTSSQGPGVKVDTSTVSSGVTAAA